MYKLLRFVKRISSPGCIGGAKDELLLSRGLSWQSGINKAFLLIASLIAAILVIASPANAYIHTGNDLKEWVDADDRVESGNASRKDYA